jgi:hypothetical protein
LADGSLVATWNRMTSIRTLTCTALVISAIGSAHAQAQPAEGTFRGGYVCEKLPTTRDILRVPLDLVIDEGTAWFARPLFNLNGDRVLGSEMATGTVDQSGRIHLTSTWSYLGNIANAEYSGTITATGGTLTGTQIWTGPGGASPVRRTCTAALVPAANESRSK